MATKNGADLRHEATDNLLKLMRTSKKPNIVLAASQEILNRTEGKPRQAERTEGEIDQSTARILIELAAKL